MLNPYFKDNRNLFGRRVEGAFKRHHTQPTTFDVDFYDEMMHCCLSTDMRALVLIKY